MTDARNAGGGGMTGATGDLTPDAMGTHPFVPAASREVADPDDRANVAEAQGGAPTSDASPADSARESRKPDLGGDERADHEDQF